MDMDAISDYFNPVHIEKGTDKYLTVDVARLGKDKTVFRVWEGFLCTYRYEIPKSTINVAVEDGVGGGFVDYLRCKGFVNNSSPLNGENYNNLKSQCSILMAKHIQSRKAGEFCNDTDVKDRTAEEMEQVKIKDLDKDGKLAIIPKETVKEKLGRSPDDWDTIMMRYWFELAPKFFTF